jgi:uncharacterized membrane protein YczE
VSVIEPAERVSWSFRQLLLPLPQDRLAQRLLRCVVGLALFGLGIRMFLTGRLGVAPWDVLHQGLSRRMGLDVGIVIELVGALILLLWIPMRQRMGIGTVLNAIEIGLVVWAIGDRLPHTDRIVLRLAYVGGGLLCVALGSGFYIGAGLGSGPRDGLMLGVAERGFSLRVARTGLELGVLAVGLLLGGTVGAGTVAFTIGIGPLVQLILPRLRLKGDTTVLATAH